MTEIADAANTDDHDWYFTEHGQREGPLSTAETLELLRSGTIAGDTLVWRKGFADWQPLRGTELVPTFLGT